MNMKITSTKFGDFTTLARSASGATGGNEPERVGQVSNLPRDARQVGNLPHRRGGFTLVEMLVVLGILLTLAAMTVAFLPTLNNYQKVQSGASRVQGWFLTAKQRALRDQVPRGIRLLVETINGRQVVRTLQYTEQPEDYSLGLLTVSADSQHATVSGSGVDLGGGFDPSGNASNLSFWPVQPGDFLMVGQDPTKPIFRITFVTSNNFSPANQITTANANLPVASASLYRVIRAPRALAGEAPLLLPQDVVIDVTGDKDTNLNPRASQIPNGGSASAVQYYDILFAPTGAVTGVYFTYNAASVVLTTTATAGATSLSVNALPAALAAGQQILFHNANINVTVASAAAAGATTISVSPIGATISTGDVGEGTGSTRSGFPGKVILWMKDITQDMNSSGQSIGQQALVTVYCRTGCISVHPVDTASPSTPFDFSQDGQDSGM